MATRKTAPKGPAQQAPARSTPKPAGLRLGAALSATEIYLDRMPGFGGPRPPKTLRATLEVDNAAREEVAFTFPSAQRFDIDVVDRRGRVITRWSENKRFASGVSEETLGPGRSWSFSGEVQIGDTKERRLTLGLYTVRIYLTADRQLRAILPVTISAAL